MRTLFLDCSFGVSGDMLISSLLGHLKDESEFRKKLDDIKCPNEVEVEIETTKRYHVKGKTFRIICENNLQPRCLDDIIKIIESGNLSQEIKQKSIKAFSLLADAESAVHGISKDKVHFHEIGAVDTIFDIVGFYILLDLLCIDKVVNTHVNLGSGKFICEHGEIPVPGPAVLEIMKGRNIISEGEEGERATPTGAVLICASSVDTDGLPKGKLISYGYGFGEKKFKDGNYLRSVIVDGQSCTDDYVYLLECNIDDMTGEQLGYAFEKLMEAGALDVWQQPLHMKKNRVGIKLSVLCLEKDDFVNLIFKHTTTRGIRISGVHRKIRGDSSFKIKDGIKIKVTGNMEKPEFEDVKCEAEKRDVSIKKIYNKLEEHNEH